MTYTAVIFLSIGRAYVALDRKPVKERPKKADPVNDEDLVHCCAAHSHNPTLMLATLKKLPGVKDATLKGKK